MRKLVVARSPLSHTTTKSPKCRAFCNPTISLHSRSIDPFSTLDRNTSKNAIKTGCLECQR